MTIPTDPIILLSFINTKLRDFYPTLDALCDDLNVDKNDIVNPLAQIGYIYDPKLNKFV